LIDLRDFYSALVQNSDDAIVAKDVDGVVLSWNTAAERLFGWSGEEMIGSSIRRLLPEDRQDEEDAILTRIRAGERVGQFFTKRVHKSGRLLDVSVTVSPVRNAAGVILGAAKIAHDAGPYLERERRLAESERRFRSMADTISQLAWIAHGDGTIFWYNQRWIDFVGVVMPRPDVRGADFVHPEHRERVLTHFRKCIAEGQEWEDTFPLRRHDGEYRRRQGGRGGGGVLVRHQHRHHRPARAGRADPPAADGGQPPRQEPARHGPGARPAHRTR
jgi:PAS domain S-box-containing protein